MLFPGAFNRKISTFDQFIRSFYDSTGAGSGFIHRAICADEAIDGVGGIGGVRKLVQLDSSKDMLFRDEHLEFEGKELCDT